MLLATWLLVLSLLYSTEDGVIEAVSWTYWKNGVE
jgi:hypothetical protein